MVSCAYNFVHRLLPDAEQSCLKRILANVDRPPDGYQGRAIHCVSLDSAPQGDEAPDVGWAT